MVTSIVQEPHKALRAISKNILTKDISSTRIQKVITGMSKLLGKEKYGVALAAPQIGENIRLFIVSGRILAGQKQEEYDPKKHKDLIFINPKVISTSRKKSELDEGCLSLRGLWGSVKRADRVKISAYNEHGEKVERGASGLLAQIFQHEIDHLDGVLYTDKAIKTWGDDEYEKEKQKRN